MYQLCQFYVKREKINNIFKEADKKNEQLEEYSSRFEGKKNGN